MNQEKTTECPLILTSSDGMWGKIVLRQQKFKCMIVAALRSGWKTIRSLSKVSGALTLAPEEARGRAQQERPEPVPHDEAKVGVFRMGGVFSIRLNIDELKKTFSHNLFRERLGQPDGKMFFFANICHNIFSLPHNDATPIPKNGQGYSSGQPCTGQVSHCGRGRHHSFPKRTSNA